VYCWLAGKAVGGGVAAVYCCLAGGAMGELAGAGGSGGAG